MPKKFAKIVNQHSQVLAVPLPDEKPPPANAIYKVKMGGSGSGDFVNVEPVLGVTSAALPPAPGQPGQVLTWTTGGAKWEHPTEPVTCPTITQLDLLVAYVAHTLGLQKLLPNPHHPKPETYHFSWLPVKV